MAIAKEIVETFLPFVGNAEEFVKKLKRTINLKTNLCSIEILFGKVFGRKVEETWNNQLEKHRKIFGRPKISSNCWRNYKEFRVNYLVIVLQHLWRNNFQGLGGNFFSIIV